jgi:hypothetical protein
MEVGVSLFHLRAVHKDAERGECILGWARFVLRETRSSIIRWVACINSDRAHLRCTNKRHRLDGVVELTWRDPVSV